MLVHGVCLSRQPCGGQAVLPVRVHGKWQLVRNVATGIMIGRRLGVLCEIYLCQYFGNSLQDGCLAYGTALIMPQQPTSYQPPCWVALWHSSAKCKAGLSLAGHVGPVHGLHTPHTPAPSTSLQPVLADMTFRNPGSEFRIRIPEFVPILECPPGTCGIRKF